MVRIVEESGAHAMFMENVPGVIAEIDAIKETLTSMGFSLRWTVVGADDVGAPHVRKRWFCLAYKPLSKLLKLQVDVTGGVYTPFDWSNAAAPPRTCKLASREEMRASDARWALLGNGVVPDAVRLGFFRLFSAGRVCRLEQEAVCFVHKDEVEHSSVSVQRMKRSDIPHVDVSGEQVVLSSEPICVPATSTTCIFLDPSALPPPETPSPNQTTATLQCVVALRRWSTPRHGMTRPCRVLTDRSSRDLPTQIVFEATTENRRDAVNADFCDWVMGLTPGYTHCPGITAAKKRTMHTLSHSCTEKCSAARVPLLNKNAIPPLVTVVTLPTCQSGLLSFAHHIFT